MTGAPLVAPLVVGISWRRAIHLDLTLNLAADPDSTRPAHTEFALLDGVRRLPLAGEPQPDGSVRLSLNVITFRDRREIPDGAWSIVPVIDGVTGPPARLDQTLIPDLASVDRTFRSEDQALASRVTFDATTGDGDPELRVLTVGFNQPARPAGPVGLRGLAKRIALAAIRMLIATVYSVARATRDRRRTTILFASERRTSLEGNLKAVYDRMLERGLDDRFELQQHVWVANHRDIRTRLVQTIRIARADCVVIDDFFPGLDLVRPRPDTAVIQAWHAGVGYKAVAFTRFAGSRPAPRETSHRRYTWAIAGSQILCSTYADIFGIEPAAVLPTGLPRIDVFLNDERRAAAMSAFADAHPEVGDRRLVLFAPTYRESPERGAYYDFDQIDFDALAAWCGDDTVVGFRMHHFVSDPVPIPIEFADRFIDLTTYPDGLGLLHSTDLLITDYSSNIYEFSLLDRPMLFFAYDRESYEREHGFVHDYEATAPGRICLNFTELMDALRTRDFEQEKVARFRERYFDRVDTGSSDRFIDWFFLDQMPEAYRRSA